VNRKARVREDVRGDTSASQKAGIVFAKRARNRAQSFRRFDAIAKLWSSERRRVEIREDDAHEGRSILPLRSFAPDTA
jgi:hypothetical protein